MSALICEECGLTIGTGCAAVRVIVGTVVTNGEQSDISAGEGPAIFDIHPRCWDKRHATEPWILGDLDCTCEVLNLDHVKSCIPEVK